MIKKTLVLFLSLISLTVQAQEGATYEQLNLSSSPFVVDNSYFKKHDVVYLSPTQLEAEGFPMGNGNIGGMIWTNDNGIEMQVNKNDLLTTLSPNENNTSILKHAARLKIDFGTPVFSWIHLKQFEGRLSLQNAEVTYKSSTAYTKTAIKTWLVKDKNVWVIECENIPDTTLIGNDLLATISLERLGSRAFSSWYSGNFAKDAAVGIGKTQTSIHNGDIILEEKGEGLHFAVACRVISEKSLPTILNKHRAEIRTNKNKFKVLLSVVTDRENDHPVEAAQLLLDEVVTEGIQQANQKKNEWYNRFWSNSFVKTGNDYIENIYYLRRYLMAAGSQGEFPVAFNGGLWRWNRDVMNWVTPHHWNTQQQYWGLCAQNDCQLMKPYLDTYFKMIPYGEKLAKMNNVSDDALQITEAHCFTGEQVSKNWGAMKHSFTEAPQIASIFWDYFDYTGDKKYLKSKAYPFMMKAANFYMGKLQWDKDKKEYFLLSSLYESASISYAKDVISDRNCIEQLLGNCIKAATILKVDKQKVKKWKYVLAHLWDRTYQQYENNGEVIAPAIEYFTEKRYSPWSWASGGSIAFPSNLIGIDEANTRVGKAVINLVNSNNVTNAHYPYPEIAARMGLGDKALEYLVNGINSNQLYPQGLMHNVTGYPNNIYNLKSIHDLLNHRYTIRSQAFFQCGMEPISNYATTINEMLLQSNEGKIRVFPAIPTAWNTEKLAFTLLARGAFIVSSERSEKALVSQVGIKSLKGNICKIKNPWSGIKDISIKRVNSRRRVHFKISFEDVIIFKTEPDAEYIITNKNITVSDQKTIYTGTPNGKVKYLGDRMLGKLSGWNDSIRK